MTPDTDREITLSTDTRKAVWQKPEIVAVTPVTETQGGGGGGPDFGSELS